MRNIISKFFFTLLALTFSVGTMWGVDPTLSFGTTSATSSSFLAEYSTEGITLSSTSSYGSGAVQLGNTPSGSTAYNANYLEILGTSAIDSVHVLMSGNGSNKTLQAPMFGWATSATSNDADTYYLPDAQTSTANSYAAAVWFKYDLTAVSVKCARLYRATKNISSTDPAYTGSSTALGNGNTIKVYGMKIWLHSSTSYTVTIDPNGGSYASTPTGWTYSAGVYTKSVAGGSFTPPTGLTNSGQDLTWKDNHGTDITFPITLAKDSTFVAQWADHATSTDATLSALSVAGCTLNETFASADEDYTVTLPFYASMPVVGDVTATKNDAHAADPAVSISGNVITIHCVAEDGTTEKDYTITVTIAPAPTASSSINIEQNVLDNTKSWGFAAALSAANIAIVDADALDSINESKPSRNEPFLGLKFKKTTSKVTIVVPDGEYLKVKFGSIDGSAGLKVSVNGAAAAAPSLTDGVYTLAASAGVKEVVFTQTGAKTVVYKQIKVNADVDAITLPWRVTYDAGDGSKGTCAKESEVWTGTALTLPAVTPVSGWNFDGWNDGTNDYAAGDPYTPTTNATLTAQYSAVASGTDLDDLTYTIGAGSPVDVGYSAGTFTYNIELPYAVYPTITVAATPVAGASIVDDATKILTVPSLPGTATFKVTDGVNNQLYTVNFTRAPKDGAVIIGADMVDNGGTEVEGENHIGAYYGAVTAKLKNLKVNSADYFIGLQLSAGQTFQEGDVLNLHTTTAATQGKVEIYAEKAGTNLIWATDDAANAVGDNKIVLTDAFGTYNAIYIVRKASTGDQAWNAYVDHVEVTRAMNPVMTAIQFNSTDVEVTSTTVAATLPNGTNLGSMTVTPTIIWNGAGTAAPTAAWAWGANTFVVTDKDGDATTYTITLTEDVVKHTVSYNTYGGSSVASEEVVEGEYLAAAPADPTKDDYIFQGWSLTNGGAVVDVTTVQVNADVEFHAIWAAETGVIKLIDALGAINTTDFTTGVTASTVNFDDADHNCAVFGDANVTDITNCQYLAGMVQYNATTNKTKVKLDFYSVSGGKKAYLFKMVEGGDVETIEIDMPTAGRYTTEFYTFNSESNRSIYVGVSDRTKVNLLQVKVIDDGETTLKRFGEAGYSLNLNKSRLMARTDATVNFEGMTVTPAAHNRVNYSTYLALKSDREPISFTIAAPVTMTVVNGSSNKYYVSTSSTGSGEEYGNGSNEFDLTVGTWYIVPKTTSAVQLTNIAFSAPKCEQPNITTQPATKIDFPAGDMTATVVAEVSDGGTLSYQWYNASDDSEVAGANAATLTTTTEGEYYVIVTNTLAGHADNSIKSDNATLGYVDLTDATLSALSYGGNAIALSAGVYEYDVNLPEGTTDVPLLAATAAMEAYGATAVPTDAAAFVSYEATSTVLVTAADHTTTQTYTVNFHVAHTIISLVDVTDDMFWDFSKTGLADGAAVGTEVIMANVAGVVNDANFKSDNIKVTANKQAGTKLQASMIMFHSTVDGVIKVVFSNTGNKTSDRYLAVNGVKTESGSRDKNAVTYYGFVPAGDVVLTVVEGDGNMLNFTSVKFIKKAAADLARDAAHGDDWMAPGELGTTCIANGAVAVGGEMYELVGKNSEGKVVFATVPNNHLVPGVPYLFQAKSTAMNFYYTDEDAASEPDNTGAMKGTFSAITLTELTNVYYFAGHALWDCADLTSLEVKANRAYVKMDEVGSASPSPAPGRRYIAMDVHGNNAPTGMDELNAAEAPVKMIIDGKMYILRGEKLYDATGRLVK